jgi:hypothetical protein
VTKLLFFPLLSRAGDSQHIQINTPKQETSNPRLQAHQSPPADSCRRLNRAVRKTGASRPNLSRPNRQTARTPPVQWSESRPNRIVFVRRHTKPHAHAHTHTPGKKKKMKGKKLSRPVVRYHRDIPAPPWFRASKFRFSVEQWVRLTAWGWAWCCSGPLHGGLGAGRRSSARAEHLTNPRGVFSVPCLSCLPV